ncbi:MAG: filamentous hemagglutinin [bacterium]|nr:filamentous hemagglutinin [bacterium]
MGTGISGYYNTKGAKKDIERRRFDANTSIVWKHIEATQEEYKGTCLPRSFNIDTPQGKMWTHGNATEHMAEAITSLKDNPRLKYSNPKLYTQFILYDYWQSIQQAVINGIKYDTGITIGNWQFAFSRPFPGKKNPVVIHAKFTGLK